MRFYKLKTFNTLMLPLAGNQSEFRENSQFYRHLFIDYFCIKQSKVRLPLMIILGNCSTFLVTTNIPNLCKTFLMSFFSLN